MEQTEQTVTEEKIVSVIREKFPDQITSVETPFDFLTIYLKAEKIVDIIKYLYEQEKYQYLTTLCGIHYPETKTIQIMYQLHKLTENKRVRLKISLSEDKPSVKTLTTVFPAANWMERETYDFYGVIFEGHPNLIRILNVEDMIIFPMRKEYPLEDQTREDKNNDMFGR
jgi:NADH-quinone oxidoreductase subunit C